jgi:RHS repeat-associated protein
VVSRHDYLPFGEEIPVNYGGRTTAMMYVANNTLTQRFTGKERDTETGLDYFGARYLSAAMGRFGGADPKLVSNAFDDPQSWFKYSYVRANPLRLVDPDGEDWVENLTAYAAGNSNGVASSNGLAPRMENNDQFFQLGQVVGDSMVVVQGAVEITLGAGGEVAGVSLDATGVGAIAGLPVGAVSTVAIVHGAAVAGNATKNLAGTALRQSKSGTYEFPDAKNPGKTYVGQSGNLGARLSEHKSSGRLAAGVKPKTNAVPGVKTDREVAEQKRINQLGGTSNKPGSKTSNKRNPIGKKREKKIEDEYGPLAPQ